jgi:hypothetical protein
VGHDDRGDVVVEPLDPLRVHDQLPEPDQHAGQGQPSHDEDGETDRIKEVGGFLQPTGVACHIADHRAMLPGHLGLSSAILGQAPLLERP